jgi:hypothetical protein
VSCCATSFVSINPNPNDLETWNAMDHASDQARKIFADAAPGAVDAQVSS